MLVGVTVDAPKDSKWIRLGNTPQVLQAVVERLQEWWWPTEIEIRGLRPAKGSCWLCGAEERKEERE
jgi:hypothetical protein